MRKLHNLQGHRDWTKGVSRKNNSEVHSDKGFDHCNLRCNVSVPGRIDALGALIYLIMQLLKLSKQVSKNI
jgi:hypothetical protein